MTADWRSCQFSDSECDRLQAIFNAIESLCRNMSQLLQCATKRIAGLGRQIGVVHHGCLLAESVDANKFDDASWNSNGHICGAFPTYDSVFGSGWQARVVGSIAAR